MGLLDYLTTDKDQQGALMQGLLAGAFGAMAGRGTRLQAIGQGGLSGLQGYAGARDSQAQAKRMGLQDQLLQMQMGQMQQQQQDAEAQRKAIQGALTPPTMPASMDARDIGQPGEAPLVPQFDMQRYATNLAQIGSPSALQAFQALQKDNTPIKVGKDEVLLDPTTRKPIFSNMVPDPAKQSPLGQLIAEMNSLPQGDPRRAIYQQAIQKASTHQPPVSVSYGAPVAGVDERGNSVFFQPSKDGRTAPAIVQGVKPAPQNRDTKLPAELQRMQIAGDAMGNLLNDYEAMLKKHNPRDPMVQANPAVRAEMQSLKRNLELQFKELQALGALAGPDIEIMRQALSDPFSMQGAYYGREGLQAQIRQARTLLKNRSDAVLRSQGKPGDAPKAEDNDPLGIRK